MIGSLNFKPNGANSNFLTRYPNRIADIQITSQLQYRALHALLNVFFKNMERVKTLLYKDFEKIGQHVRILMCCLHIELPFEMHRHRAPGSMMRMGRLTAVKSWNAFLELDDNCHCLAFSTLSARNPSLKCHLYSCLTHTCSTLIAVHHSRSPAVKGSAA